MKIKKKPKNKLFTSFKKKKKFRRITLQTSENNFDQTFASQRRVKV